MTPGNLRKSQELFEGNALSFICACLIGDGSLAESGRLVIAHGNQQKDYCEWKAAKLSQVVGQTIKALPTRNCHQIQFQRKFLRDLRYKLYPNNKKSIINILPYVTNPLETVAIWICDDGNISPSIGGKQKKCYSAAIQIFTFTDEQESILIADWFERELGVRPKLTFMDRSKEGKKSAYKLKFTAQDSYKLFNMIYDYIPKIPSMEFKFRFIYNLSKRPRQLSSDKTD